MFQFYQGYALESDVCKMAAIFIALKMLMYQICLDIYPIISEHERKRLPHYGSAPKWC